MTHRVEGVGVGFRIEMADALIEREPPEIDWLELHPENYMQRGGGFTYSLARARERWPFATHGLTMCFGNTAPFERSYLDPLRAFLRDLETPWHSDHLCFGAADGRMAHDLLPLPFTEEAVANCVQRFTEARDALDITLAFENVSYYAPQSEDGLVEADFVREVLERADGRMLFDVNNLYVNSQNFGFDPLAYIDRIPLERVVQIHVAGHLIEDEHLRIDTHGEPIGDGVYVLLERVLERTGPVPVLLERDNNIPPLDVLLDEVRRLRAIYDRATPKATRATRSTPARGEPVGAAAPVRAGGRP